MEKRCASLPVAIPLVVKRWRGSEEEAGLEYAPTGVVTVSMLIHTLDPAEAGDGAEIVICGDGSYPYVDEGAVGDSTFIDGCVALRRAVNVGASEDLGALGNGRAD